MARSCEHADTECVTCRRERWGSVQLSRKATPTKSKSKALCSKPNNSWEKGIPRDERGVPFLDKKGGIVYQKEFVENRRQWRNTSREQINVGS